MKADAVLAGSMKVAAVLAAAVLAAAVLLGVPTMSLHPAVDRTGAMPNIGV